MFMVWGFRSFFDYVHGLGFLDFFDYAHGLGGSRLLFVLFMVLSF